jgi:hypothetical protein
MSAALSLIRAIARGESLDRFGLSAFARAVSKGWIVLDDGSVVLNVTELGARMIASDGSVALKVTELGARMLRFDDELAASARARRNERARARNRAMRDLGMRRTRSGAWE